jgi:gliding motility-associated-like protein
MKKSLLLLFALITANVFSQSITVDSNTYTVPQLVNNVLINSPCINATNITWRTGTNFGSTNGIGYFQNTNPNFPMQSGVILSTGNIANAAGPNTSMQSSGSNAWTGDATLEATLASYGVNMTSANATVLEFDFVPMSPNFNFNFLFASEEYGNFQCQFSDAFAFLLTNMTTGVTTNLAVVPGTNTPISVVTIRDFLYNSTCPSVNPQYFGSFNGGTNAAGSATNFNGQTKVMNAAATLTPNTPYRIKLVIADRGDYQSDSAIFISSNSFNIGQDVLGSDYLLSDNTAICNSQNHLINSGLNPAVYSFVWKKDGVVMSGETGPSISVNQPGTYQLVYTNIAFPCQTITNDVVIEYFSAFTTPNPVDLHKCNSGAASYTYDFSFNTSKVTFGLGPNFSVNYFTSLLDANNNSNALPNIYTSSGNQTIYVRINNGTSGCYIIKSFQLLVSPPPVANHPADIINCKPITGSTSFNLSSVIPSILGSQSSFVYKALFYNTLADANNGTNPLGNTFTTNTNTTLYVRVQLITDSGCYATTTINLVVMPLPLVDTMNDVVTCSDYILPPLTNGNYFTASGGGGTALFAGDVITQSRTIYIYNATTTTPSCPNETNFKVTIIKPDSLAISSNTYCGSYTLPPLTDGSYHTAPNGGGMNLPGGTVLTTSQTIYFNYVSQTPPICTIDAPFNIDIITAQTVQTLPNAFDCTSYVLQPLSFGNYYDGPNGTGNQIPAGTAINTSQTIYIHGENGTCKSDSSFEVVIGMNFPTSVTECAGYTLPQLVVGNYYTGPVGTGTQIPAGTLINTTQTIYVYAVSQSQPNCTDNYNFTVSITLPVITPPTVTVGCDNFTLPALSIGDYYTGTGASGTMLHAGDVLTNSQTLFVYLNDGMGCQNEISFDVTINQTPVIDSRATIDACHSYTLTNLAQGNYYTGPNGTGTMLTGGTTLTDSQLVYIYANNNGCAAETSFQINIFQISAFQTPNVTACDTYVLPTLPGNNKYYTQTGGQYGTGVELPAGTVITTSQTVYIYVESGGRINCSNESSFTVTLIPTPVIAPIANVTACSSYTLPVLTVGDYYTQPNKGGNQLHAGDVITTNQTLYVYAETGGSTNCYTERSFTISIYNVDTLQNVTICSGYTLPSLVVGNYYNGPNGTGGLIPVGTTIHTTKTIYIFGNSGYSPNCTDESIFTVTIVPTPVANAVPLVIRTTCDSDGTNDGIYNFDLTTFTSTVLGTQTGPEYSAVYYTSLADATTNTNPVTNSTLTTVYVRVNNALAPNCFDVKPIALVVNKIPEPNPQDGVICYVTATGHLINPYTFHSGLSSATHTFKWYNAQGQLVGTGANYTATVPGTYSVVATSIATGCSSVPAFATANSSEPAVVSYAVNEDFADSQTVTITTEGTGDYEYQLDNGVFQDSPVFDNVMSGFHTITVRDKNGCGLTTTDAIVVNYPHYFTPNGDGIHDTWNIKDLSDDTVSMIYIFDRFGKLVKKVKPSGQGWDGTYNNTLMPSDDYWFTINYQKDGEEKEFKAHFALKR